MWGYLTGVGLIDPLDDIRAGNPPSNPELLQYLTNEFIQSGFNVRHLMKLIANSRTYQLSSAANELNRADEQQLRQRRLLSRRDCRAERQRVNEATEHQSEQ